MLKKKKWSLFAISLFCLSSCTPKPPDVPACEHLGQHLSNDPATGHLLLNPSPTCMEEIGEPECGHCVFIRSGNIFFVGEKEGHLYNKKPWSKLRQQSVYLPAEESYAPLAAYIIDSCKKMHCSEELEKFRIKLNSLNGVAKALAIP